MVNLFKDTGATILLIEPDAAFTGAQAELLSKAGYCVLHRTSAEAGLAVVQEVADLSLVLMSIDPPVGVSGIDTARQMLQLRAVPLFLRVSVADPELLSAVTGLAGCGILMKDLPNAALLASLRMALAARAGHEFLAARERYRELLYTMPQIAVQGYDRSGRVVYWNAAAETLYGYSPQEALGAQLLDLIIPEQMHEAVSKDIARCFKQGVPIASGELLLRRKDGSMVPVFSSHAYMELPGLEAELYCLDIDLSALKEAEQEVRGREARLRMVAELAPVGIVLLDAHERGLYMNSTFTELFGYTTQELPSVDAWWPLAYPDPERRAAIRRSWVEQTAQAAAAHQEMPPMETQVCCKDGSRKMVEFRYATNGETAVVVLSDISERKRAEEQASRLFEDMKLLLRETHHRIKNNFATVESFLLLQSHNTNEPAAVQAMKNAASRITGMRVLYDKLLLSGTYTSVSAHSYLHDLVGCVERAYKGTHGRVIEVQVEDMELRTEAVFPLGAIVTELLTNSLKYAYPTTTAPEDARVQLSLSRHHDHAVLCVADQGVGLPDTLHEEDSESFGLMVVRMMSEQLGGGLTLDSAPNNGTKATVRLPLSRTVQEGKAE